MLQSNGSDSALPIPTPSKEECQKYQQFSDEHYKKQGKAVEKVFAQYPKNDNIEEILIKTAILNDFYSTAIKATYSVAEVIFNLKIDPELEKNDVTIVNKIADATKNRENTNRREYVFSTKYCAIHKPQIFPIYDNLVARVLCYFGRKDNFFCFKNKDLRDYTQYVEIYHEFINFYGLKDFTLRQVDYYLWQLGKKYFK